MHHILYVYLSHTEPFDAAGHEKKQKTQWSRFIKSSVVYCNSAIHKTTQQKCSPVSFKYGFLNASAAGAICTFPWSWRTVQGHRTCKEEKKQKPFFSRVKAAGQLFLIRTKRLKITCRVWGGAPKYVGTQSFEQQKKTSVTSQKLGGTF